MTTSGPSPSDRTADLPPSGEFPPPAETLGAEAIAGTPLREGPGARLGPYRIVSLIGEGGFGTVFMAQQEHPVKRNVAIKIIKLGMDTRQVVARFEQERQALAMMDHPNIARVYDAGATDTGRPYFVMELVQGEPIVEYCDRNNLSIQARLELFEQVCEAVQHAHTKGIIHRDIKPSNILVSTQDGRASTKVIDFGIAKATSGELTQKTQFTENRQLIGTPAYMSPEQAEGSLDIDTRTDVYSLGVLLYELLTGSTPFSDTELRSAAYGEIQRIIREVDPPVPSTRISRDTDTLAGIAAKRHTEPRRLNSTIRGELDWIVMKALEKDRQRRYETASGLAADIRRHLTGEAVLAAPPSRSYRVKKFVRRHRGAVTAAAAVAAALLVGVVAFAWQARIAGAQRDLAIDAEQRASAEAARAMVAEAKAADEARSARQIAEFLASMLKSAGPRVALGRDATLLKDVADKAAERVESELKDQPVVALRLMEVLGNVYNTTAEFDKCERMARKRVEIARTLPAPNEANVAEAMASVGGVLDSKGKYDEASTVLKEAIELFKSVGAEKTSEGLQARSALAGVYYRRGDYATAEPLFREVLAARRELAGGKDDESLATALDRASLSINTSRRDQGRDDRGVEAEALQREALAMRRRLFGEVHPDVAVSLSNLAAVLAQQGKLDEAIEMSQAAVAQHQKIFGAEHPWTAESMGALANILETARRIPEAIEYRRAAIEIFRKVLGAENRKTLDAVFLLGSVLREEGRFAEAEEQFRVMLAYGVKNYPPGDLRTAGVKALVAAVVNSQGRYGEAETILREILEARVAKLDKGHASIVAARRALADNLVMQKRHADAEPLLIANEADANLPTAKPDARAAAAKALAAFYEDWEKAEPGKGHDAQAAEWNAHTAGAK